MEKYNKFNMHSMERASVKSILLRSKEKQKTGIIQF